MAIEDIKKDLDNRFAEPLPEFYKRRIIFWNDEEGEFKEEIESLALDNAKVLALSETNQFASKKLLNEDDLTSNYLVYNPIVTDNEHDWFLDIKLYSEEYRADLISRWMQEMNILNTGELRSEVKMLKGFFNAQARRNRIAAFGDVIDRKSQLYMSVLAAICGIKDRTPEAIIKAVLEDGSNYNNKLTLEFLKYNMSTQFFMLANKACGYTGNTNVDHLAEHVVLSALCRTLSSKVLSGLENKYSEIRSDFCYGLMFNWLHSDDQDKARDVLENIEQNLHLRSRFEQFELDDLVDTDIVSSIDMVVISKLMNNILNNTITSDSLMTIVDKRRTSVWFEDFRYYYDGLYQVSLMKKFYEKHLNGFHHTVAKEMWNAYTSDYYQMDAMYRNFHNTYSNILKTINSYLDDDFKRIVDYVEREYKNWYLNGLAENWTKIIENDLKTNGYISGIKQQDEFYRRDVANNENKIFVIISDALRYDVAADLCNQLRIETKCDISIDSQEAIFPTITKFGMAALLPHRELSVTVKNNEIRVLADGCTTEMADRDAVLKNRKKNSVALKYKDIITMKGDERREAIKGMDIVYIYHDTIDATSHNDETKVFDACEEAIAEIKNLVKIITGGMSGVNIVITSDHGFLYTYQPLNEDDKMEKSSFKDNVIEQGRRYVLTDDKADPDFLLPVKGFYNAESVLGFAPRENIRIKTAGGQNFVHGGVSLQEMVVPVIKYKYLRAGYKSYERNKDKYDAKPVTVALLSSNRKISNMIFNLSFYQKEPVKDNYVPCTYEVYITDEKGAIVSDRQKIIADRESTVAKDREFKITFNLQTQIYNSHDIYYLVIIDADGKQLPIREEMQIDIAMAFDDFDFFG